MPAEASPAGAPITVFDLAFYVQVEVGETPCMAQLDTGSQNMMVAQSFSKDFSGVEETNIRGAFKETKTRRIRLPTLKWLGRSYPSLVAVVRPDFGEGLPFQVEATLGNSVLLAQPLYLDFVRIQIGVVAPDGYRSVLRVPLKEAHGLPLLELSLGEKRLRAIFDLGAGVSVLNEKVSLPSTETILSDVVEDAMGGSRRFSLHRGPPISLGGSTLAHAEYMTMSLGGIEEKLGSPIDFILGANTLLRTGGVWKLDLQGGYADWG